MRMCPIAKFLFKLIYNGNIFPATRKVIPSLSYCEIEAIKVLGIKFRKNLVQRYQRPSFWKFHGLS